jgi:hypothetical protein
MKIRETHYFMFDPWIPRSVRVEPSPVSRSQLERLPKNFHYLPMRLRRAAARIHLNDPLRFTCGNRFIASMYATKKSPILLLEAVFVAAFSPTFVRSVVRLLISPPRSSDAQPKIRIQQDS